MKKTFRLLAITVIIAMLMPFTMVKATTSRTEKIVESLKESAKSYDGTVNFEDGTIEIEWNIPNLTFNTIEFNYNDNVIEYNSGEITSYEQAEDVISHSLYAIYLIESALRVNGYSDEAIQSFWSSSELSYDINGIELKHTGESQKFTSEDETSTINVAPIIIRIDVTKANPNTSSDEPATPTSTTIEDIVADLQADSEFKTTLDDEGKIMLENEIDNDDEKITIDNTSYMYKYYNVLFDCEDDVLTYEDGELEDYYEAERALSHQLYANQILMLALKTNGYTNEQIQEFMSSEDNEFDYELNGIEIKEIGEGKKFTSDDGLDSVFVTPMSIKIDLVKANLKEVSEEETQTKEYTVNSNTNSGDSIVFTAKDGEVYSFSIIDRLATTDEELQQIVDLFNNPEYTFEVLKEQLNKIIDYGKKAAGDSGTLLKLYEIYLTNNGTEVHEVDSEFKIKLKMTDDMKGYDTYKLIYIADDGTTEKAIELTKNGEYLEGTLPHLSMYALVGNKTENDTADLNTTVETTNTIETTTSNTNTEAKANNPKTGDNIITVFCVFAISLLGVFIIIKLNRNKNVRKQ